MNDPKLYLVHCGFYDEQTSFGGVYEGHTNLFIVSDSPQYARHSAKASELFKTKRMHIDGIQEIEAVDGYRIQLVKDESLAANSHIASHIFRDLAPPAKT